MKRTLWCSLIVVALAACARGGSALLPVAANGGGAAQLVRAHVATGTLHFTVAIPTPPPGARPRYVSPSTKSMQIKAYNATLALLLATNTFELTPGSPGCAATSKGLTCTESLAVPAGSDRFFVTLYDQTNAGGKALSAMRDFPHTVVAGKTATLAIALGGLATSLYVVPPQDAGVTGLFPGPFTITGNAPQAFSLYAVDADGNFIVGPGAPIPAIEGTPVGVHVTPPLASAPNTWTMTSAFHSTTSPRQSASSSILVEATPVPNSGGATVKKSIALKLLQPWIYVMNYSASSYAQAITAYDEYGNQKTLTGGWSTLTKPGWALYVPSNNLLYVSESFAPGGILAFDLMGNNKTIGGNFANAYFPGQMTLDTANNEIYVPNNQGPNYVTAYDLQGNQQSLPSGAFPEMMDGADALVYDPGNGWLYGTSFADSAMAAYTSTGQTLTDSGFANLGKPEGIAYDPNNGLFYVANYRPYAPQNAVTVYDAAGGQHALAGGFPNLTSPGGIGLDPYDGKIFVSNYATYTGSIAVFDEQGNAQTLGSNAFSSVNGPYGIVVVP